MRIFRIELTLGRALAAALLLVLSVGIAAAAALAVPAKYSSNAQVLFLSGTQDAAGRAANPFLQFSDSLSITGNVISAATTSPGSLAKIAAAGGSRDVTIVPAGSNDPLLLITATASTPAQAQRTVRIVEDRMRAELAERQAAIGAPPSTIITMVSITDISRASRLIKTSVQVGLGVLALSLFASIALLALIARRPARAHRHAAAADSAHAAPDDLAAPAADDAAIDGAAAEAADHVVLSEEAPRADTPAVHTPAVHTPAVVSPDEVRAEEPARDAAVDETPAVATDDDDDTVAVADGAAAVPPRPRPTSGRSRKRARRRPTNSPTAATGDETESTVAAARANGRHELRSDDRDKSEQVTSSSSPS